MQNSLADLVLNMQKGQCKADTAPAPVDSCCPLCESVFLNGDERVELPCSHSFHSDCLSEHFLEVPYCPTCKKLVPGARPGWMLGGDTLADMELDAPTASEEDLILGRPENGVSENSLKKLTTYNEKLDQELEDELIPRSLSMDEEVMKLVIDEEPSPVKPMCCTSKTSKLVP